MENWMKAIDGLFCDECGSGLKDGVCYNWENCLAAEKPEIE